MDDGPTEAPATPRPAKMPIRALTCAEVQAIANSGYCGDQITFRALIRKTVVDVCADPVRSTALSDAMLARWWGKDLSKLDPYSVRESFESDAEDCGLKVVKRIFRLSQEQVKTVLRKFLKGYYVSAIREVVWANGGDEETAVAIVERYDGTAGIYDERKIAELFEPFVYDDVSSTTSPTPVPSKKMRLPNVEQMEAVLRGIRGGCRANAIYEIVYANGGDAEMCEAVLMRCDGASQSYDVRKVCELFEPFVDRSAGAPPVSAIGTMRPLSLEQGTEIVAARPASGAGGFEHMRFERTVRRIVEINGGSRALADGLVEDLRRKIGSASFTTGTVFDAAYKYEDALRGAARPQGYCKVEVVPRPVPPKPFRRPPTQEECERIAKAFSQSSQTAFLELVVRIAMDAGASDVPVQELNEAISAGYRAKPKDPVSGYANLDWQDVEKALAPFMSSKAEGYMALILDLVARAALLLERERRSASAPKPDGGS